jgi:hypothetical protein
MSERVIMSEQDRERTEGARKEALERFFPAGMPHADAVTEEAVRRIIKEVDERIREEGARHVPEDPGMSEEVLKYVHTI